MLKHISNVPDMTQSYYKIFCDFHEKDFSHFQKIKDDIFNVCRCAVFYTDNDSLLDFPEASICIENANLYVLIVSANVISDPDFNAEYFHKAKENNIPILPIIIENDLEELFNGKFGNLQCISTCLEYRDPTAVPYSEKLQNFLSQTFSLSFDVEKLRQAFDTSVFLSYRKKDRAYAQKLLDIIHSNDELKNVAVWYDEFLIPGEDFNDSIKNELESSAAFLLMVTPSVLEEKNYIKIVEYPIARSLNKSILPVVIAPTDTEDLKNAYPEIPETVSAADTKALRNTIIDVLKKNNVVISERTAERDFFIGFAFLKGLYVEKNSSVALEMLSRAAEENIIPAIQTLTFVYKYGDGCEIDYEKAVYWQKKSVALSIEAFENNENPENASAVLSEYKELADIYTAADMTDNAASAYMDSIGFLEGSSLAETDFAKERCAEIYESAAGLYINKGDYARARYDFTEKAITLRKELYSKASSVEREIDLAIAYLTLAKCQKECDDIIGLKSTVKVEMKKIRNALLDYKISKDSSLQKLLIILSGLNELGSIYNLLNNQADAFVFIGAAFNLSNKINDSYKTQTSMMHTYNAYKNDGEQHIKINVENHLRNAKNAFENAHRIALSLHSQNETLESSLTVAQSHLNLARIMHKFKNEASAKENAKTAIGLYEKAFASIKTTPTKQRLYNSYYTVAEIYTEFKDYDTAEEMLDKGISLNEELIDNSTLAIYKLEIAEALKLKAELLKKQWDFEEALICYQKRHEFIKAGAHKNVHIYLLAESYETLIAANKSNGNFDEAKMLENELLCYKEKYSHVFNGNVKLLNLF